MKLVRNRTKASKGKNERRQVHHRFPGLAASRARWAWDGGIKSLCCLRWRPLVVEQDRTRLPQTEVCYAGCHGSGVSHLFRQCRDHRLPLAAVTAHR